MRFNKKTAIVTGGAGGFGRSFARALAAEGCNIVLADVDDAGLADNATLLKKRSGAGVAAVVCDVTNGESVNDMAARAMALFGSIDILINNAGGSLRVPKAPINEIEEADWDKVVNVNLKGTFLCTRAVAGYMKKASRGKIVNLSSITARMGGQLTPVQYVSAKGAIISFTRHVAQELGPYGVNVNAVAPGIVLTGERMESMWLNRKTEEDRQSYLQNIPLRRLADVDEITKTVLFLCSDDAAYITGVTLDINGGLFSV